MAKRPASNFDLFEAVERQDEKIKAEAGVCEHKFEKPDERSWPGFPMDPRCVWVCESCGQLRGRMPKKFGPTAALTI